MIFIGYTKMQGRIFTALYLGAYRFPNGNRERAGLAESCSIKKALALQNLRNEFFDS